MSMSPADYEALLEKSMTELDLKTKSHQAGWGLGDFERWDLVQTNGTLVFSDPLRGRAECPAQIIGSWEIEQSTWLWAWDNPSIENDLKRDALRVKKFGEDNGIEQLIFPEWVISERDAWRLTALAVHLCNAQGAYRGPAGPAIVFVSFSSVRLSKPNASFV